MDMSDEIERNKQQIVDKAAELTQTAKPYFDQITKYAKANPIEAMAVTGIVAFLMGAMLSRR